MAGPKDRRERIEAFAGGLGEPLAAAVAESAIEVRQELEMDFGD